MDADSNWTQQNDIELMRLVDLNRSDCDIAKALNKSIADIQQRREMILKWRESEMRQLLRPYSLTQFVDKNDNESAYWCCSCSIPSTLSVEKIILCDHCGEVWSHWECVGLNSDLSNVDMRTHYHICYECKSKISIRREWTLDYDTMLIQSINDGMKIDEIARKMVRSQKSITDRINALDLMKKTDDCAHKKCFLSQQQINNLVVGDKCDCMDYLGRFLPVVIKQKKVLKIKIHFIGFSTKYDIWMNVDEQKKFAKYASISTLKNERNDNVRVGDLCDALIENEWIRCKVIAFDERENEIKSDQVLVEDIKHRQRKRWFHPCSDKIHFTIDSEPQRKKRRLN